MTMTTIIIAGWVIGSLLMVFAFALGACLGYERGVADATEDAKQEAWRDAERFCDALIEAQAFRP